MLCNTQVSVISVIRYTQASYSIMCDVHWKYNITDKQHRQLETEFVYVMHAHVT